MTNQKIFLAVAGNIGTGKTTLTQMLSDRFGWVPHYEPVGNNPYLDDFYKDMKRWAFPLQIYFLTHRFSAHRTITYGGTSAIQDRSIYEDAHIFARNLFEQGLMEERDYQNYLFLYESMCQSLTPPDLMIYLRKSLPQLKKGIAKRNRAFELNIADDYLSSLNRYYEDWIGDYQCGRKLIIDCDSLDYVSSSEDFNAMCQKILSALDQDDFLLNSSIQKSIPVGLAIDILDLKKEDLHQIG